MRKLALIATFCLACVADMASALGLGDIELYSSLNQPLRAEIPLFAIQPGEAALINVAVAPNSAFERTGRDRAPILSELRFRVVEGASSDQAVVQVTTTQPVREPFLAMLIEVTWPDGRLVREFTLLLDPPVIASGRSERRPTTNFEQPSFGGSFGGAYEQPSRAASTEGRGYGPVREQETLWSIAHANRPDDSISMDQMMQAIYQANPDAFDGDMTRIRAGSMLRIPGSDEIRGVSPSQARQEGIRQRRASGTGPAPVQMDDVAPAPTVIEAPPPTQPKGELKLSPPAESAASGSEAVPAESAPAPEAQADGGGTAPPAAEAAAPARASAPIEIRDNSAKAIELLTAHARDHATRQAASDQLTTETTQATTPAPAAQPATPATPPAVATPVPAETAPPAETPPVAGAETGTQAPASPFADDPAAGTTTAPATPPAAEQPPATVDVDSAKKKKPAPTVDDSLPKGGDAGSGLNPLLLALGAAAVLLLGLAAVGLRKYRARKSTVQLAPIVLSPTPDLGAEPPFGDTLETPAVRTPGRMADTLKTSAEPAMARTVETTLQNTLQSTLPPEQTTRQFMAVSTPTPTTMPAMVEPAAAVASDPYADALGEVDIHIAYGLYDEAARLLQEPLAKSPERKDLHLKLLEVHFSANMPAEFEAQAKKMQAVISGPADPDWEKVCIMGRQLCPDSALFTDGGAAGGAGLGTTADLDISSMLTGAAAPATTAAPAPKAAAAAPEAAATPATLDFDLSGFELGVSATPAAAPKPAAPTPTPAPAAAPAAPPADSGTLDFNLDDFKLDVPAAAPAESKAASALTPAAADQALDIDLADFDLGTPEPAAPAAKPAVAPADKTGEIGIDDLMSPDLEAGEGQADTRLDLARAYLDMGEPAMAQSLLQEVIAQGNPAQKQEAQELLGRLGST
jgi:pilus assembly protein FimV